MLLGAHAEQGWQAIVNERDSEQCKQRDSSYNSYQPPARKRPSRIGCEWRAVRSRFVQRRALELTTACVGIVIHHRLLPL
jgi:hypothetical protein